MTAKHDSMTKAQLVSELRRVSAREERLKEEVKPLRPLAGLKELDKDAIDTLKGLFRLDATPLEVAHGLRGMADRFDPGGLTARRGPGAPAADTGNAKETLGKGEEMVDANQEVRTGGGTAPEGGRSRLTPAQLEGLARSARARGGGVDPDMEARIASTVTEQVVKALNAQREAAEADQRRDALAEPFIAAGYLPQVPEHLDALNMAVAMRNMGHPEEKVMESVRLLYPLAAGSDTPQVQGDTPQEVAESVSGQADRAQAQAAQLDPLVAANVPPPVPRVAAVTHTAAEPAAEGAPDGRTPPAADSYRGGGLYTREGQEGFVDQRGVGVPPIGDKAAFADFVDKGVAEMVAQQQQVGV